MYREHNHIITQITTGVNVSRFMCECGETYLGPDRIVRTLIMAHRMEVFPFVRHRLGGSV